MATQKPSVARLAVNLTAEDDALMIRLRAALERKQGKRVPATEIVRIALRNLALSELAD